MMSENERKNAILMMCHYQDLDGVSDWSCHKENLLQLIKSPFQIRVVTHHQYGVLTLFLTHHSSGLPVVAIPKVSCILRPTQIHFISRLSIIIHMNVVLNREEKFLHHVPMVAKFLDDTNQ